MTICSGILAGTLFAVAMGMGDKGVGNLPNHWAALSIPFAVVAVIANIVALAAGIRAWLVYSLPCPWILVNASLFVGTVWWINMLLH